MKNKQTKNKRAVEFQLTEFIGLLLAGFVLLAAFAYISQIGSVFLGSHEQFGTLNNFNALTKKVNESYINPADFVVVKDFPFQLQSEYMLLGFDSDEQAIDVMYLDKEENFVIQKPQDCARAGCLCLYRMKGPELVTCAKYLANVRFITQDLKDKEPFGLDMELNLFGSNEKYESLVRGPTHWYNSIVLYIEKFRKDDIIYFYIAEQDLTKTSTHEALAKYQQLKSQKTKEFLKAYELIDKDVENLKKTSAFDDANLKKMKDIISELNIHYNVSMDAYVMVAKSLAKVYAQYLELEDEKNIEEYKLQLIDWDYEIISEKLPILKAEAEQDIDNLRNSKKYNDKPTIWLDIPVPYTKSTSDFEVVTSLRQVQK